MRKGIGVSVIIAVAVVLGVIAFLGHHSKTADDSKVVPRQTDQAAVGEQGQSAVAIKDMAFTPATITVKKGTTVTWTNQDSMQHGVVSDSNSPQGGLNSSLINSGQQFSFAFTTAGTYTYHCSVHSTMKATVIVTE
jgi:plastocyanin